MSDTAGAKLDELLRSSQTSPCLCIGIAGGSGSGKSTICELIRSHRAPVTPGS